MIDNAARFLVLGYGFNDQQLETHLRPQLTKGLPAAILTKGLSNNAEEVIKASPSTIALSEAEEGGKTGTLLTTPTNQVFYPDIALWDLGTLISEVLQP